MNVWPQINADGKDYMPFFLLDVDKVMLLLLRTQSGKERDNTDSPSDNAYRTQQSQKARQYS